jgi:UDP-N-acetylmuramyl pentapeptide phosphotransferase/UDP-N-acetylglucosamine-1-phosphate transferase
MIALAVFVIAAVLSALIVARVKRHAILDHPTDRGLHDVPTPRGGGLGIVIVSLLAWTIAAAAGRLPLLTAAAWPLGALLVAAVSFADDIRSLPRGIRFAVHVVAALIAVAAYGAWLPVLAMPLALFWIVAFTNIYNFMDGSNGMAGVQALVAGAGWLLLGAMGGQVAISIVGAAIVGASLGFLRYNWTPATIFMGDVGATFLGYTFAVLPLMILRRDPWGATAGALFVWPFLFDGTLTIIRRAFKRENILVAHRSHLYQRLIRCGWSHSEMALLYGSLALLGGAMMLFSTPKSTLVVIALAALGLFALTALIERRLPKRAGSTRARV